MVVASQPTESRDNLRVGPHRVDVEPSPRRVRVIVAGETIADSRHALLLRESNHLPVYYFPAADIRSDLLTRTELHTRCPYKGDASYWTITVGERTIENAVWAYEQPLAGREDIAGYQAFYWDRVDAWYEEEEQVFKHPRDPYHRVDALLSSRHVKVVVDGRLIAESRRPHLLFETGLPTRYYLPVEDVRTDLLEPTQTTSVCPYKGQASYWRIAGDATARDIAWSYMHPIAECPKIAGLLAFFNERVDELYVDDELQPKPRTPLDLNLSS
jgi:uncharacterized protein (DUF427 family)